MTATFRPTALRGQRVVEGILAREGPYRSKILNAAASAFCLPRCVPHRDRGGSGFDDSWSLVIETTRGSCPTAVRAGVRILVGHVSADDPSYMVAGRVARNGTVRVKMFAAGQSGGAHGRLSMGTGRGVWRTSLVIGLNPDKPRCSRWQP